MASQVSARGHDESAIGNGSSRFDGEVDDVEHPCRLGKESRLKGRNALATRSWLLDNWAGRLKVWADREREVYAMTVLTDRPRADLTQPRMTTEWTLGLVGVIAAAVGAWMYYVPADWFLGGLAEVWYLGMFIGAGVLIALAAGIYARQMFRVDQAWSGRVVFATAVAVLALAAAIFFAFVLIL
jgi:hypothetical protein